MYIDIVYYIIYNIVYDKYDIVYNIVYDIYQCYIRTALRTSA